MKTMNFTDYHHLEAYYSTKILDKAKKLNKKVSVWQGRTVDHYALSHLSEFLREINVSTHDCR